MRGDLTIFFYMTHVQALKQLAIKSGDGMVTCPATGTKHFFVSATKMYIS